MHARESYHKLDRPQTPCGDLRSVSYAGIRCGALHIPRICISPVTGEKQAGICSCSSLSREPEKTRSISIKLSISAVLGVKVEIIPSCAKSFAPSYRYVSRLKLPGRILDQSLHFAKIHIERHHLLLLQTRLHAIAHRKEELSLTAQVAHRRIAPPAHLEIAYRQQSSPQVTGYHPLGW